MLSGFEEYTYDLSEEEKEIAREVWKILDQSNRPVTNKEICQRLKDEKSISTSGPRVRKMINWMHTSGHLTNLIASSKGYYFASSKDELADYADSLRGRINAIGSRWQQVMKDLKNWKDG